MKNLNTLWLEEVLPVANGIIFEDGKIIQFSVDGKTHEKVITPIKKTKLSIFLEEEVFVDSSIDRLAEIALNSDTGFFKGICGEGSWGGDGFVVLLKDRNTVAWAAVFDYSNPFEKINFINGNLVACNNLGELWFFPIKNPTEFFIV